MSQWKRIFKMAAEGGCVSMMGRESSSGGWFFKVVRDESVFADLLDDVDEELLRSEDIATSWSEALTLLDHYPWHKMYPQGPFHAEFHDLIWAALIDRDTNSRHIDKWAVYCGKAPVRLSGLQH